MKTYEYTLILDGIIIKIGLMQAKNEADLAEKLKAEVLPASKAIWEKFSYVEVETLKVRWNRNGVNFERVIQATEFQGWLSWVMRKAKSYSWEKARAAV